MAALIAKASKYRHTVCTPGKKEDDYDAISNLTNAVSDCSNGMDASGLYFAVASGGTGSSLTIVPLNERKRKQYSFLGHGLQINDLQFAPYSDHILASCSYDPFVKVWKIPEGGLTEDTSSALATLEGHEGGVSSVRWNPSAANILSSSTRKIVRVWDVEKSVAITTSNKDIFSDSISDVVWNYNGSQIAVVSKDKNLRLMDPRNGEVTATTSCHDGSKTMRAVYAGSTGNLITTGFNKGRFREVGLWDPRALTAPVQLLKVDSGTSVNMPFYDASANLLYLLGGGDTSIRYYELDEGTLKDVGIYRDDVQHAGGAFIPKRSLNSNDCEIARILRLTKKSVTPLSLSVPRKEKARVFQEDLYSDSVGLGAAIEAAAWKDGENAEPKLVKILPSNGTYSSSTVTSSPMVSPSITNVKNSSSASSTPTTSPSVMVDKKVLATTWNKNATTGIIPTSSRPSSERIPTEEEKRIAELKVQEEEKARMSAKFNSYIGDKIKFKHASGEGTKKFHAWFNATPDVGGATDSDGIAVSTTHFAIQYKGAGGAVLVHPLNEPCKLLPGENLLRGHKSVVLDLAFSPFNDQLLYTAGDDSDVKVWKIPAGKLTADMKPEDASVVFSNHKSSVRCVVPHPSADGIILTGSMDSTVRLWDVEAGSEKSCFSDLWKDTFYNFFWKADGSSVALVSRDQKLTVFDPRTGKISAQTSSHEGAKAQRVVWCGNSNYLITTGSNKSSLREVFLWDVRNLPGGKISSASFGQGSGALLPQFDADTNTLLVGSKGDLTIKLYEVHQPEGLENASIHYCNDWTANVSQCEPKPLLGLASFPKRVCNVNNVEFTRLMRLTTETIDPITFRMPRAADLMEYFQDDIYVPAAIGKPGLKASQWFAGENREVPTASLCPPGQKLLSEKPPEEVKISKSREVLKSIKKQETLKEKKAEVLNNFTQMAIEREKYHPNLSGGVKGEVDADVAEDEWE